MNDIMTVEREEGKTPHCETVFRNSLCPYLERGCMGCRRPPSPGTRQFTFHITLCREKMDTKVLQDLEELLKRMGKPPGGGRTA